MPDPATLLVFTGAALLLIVIPGPAVLYILAQSVEHGRTAGLVSAAGIGAGGLVHIAAAVIGLSSLILSSAVAFSIVKYAGAAYLIYLGVRRLLAREPADRPEQPAPAALGAVFRRGIVVNVLNPKTALFFLAFLPQFVDPGQGAVPLQLVILGTTFVTLALLSDGLYALAAGTIAQRIRRRRARRRVDAARYATASVYLGLGTATALASRH